MRLLLVSILLIASQALAFDVTRCGQFLDEGEVGVLQADLDCPALPGTCMLDRTTACMGPADCNGSSCATGQPTLHKRSTLMLNGHTITSHNPNVLQRWGVLADTATIQGPGAITVPGGVAVSFGGRKLTIRDVEIHDSRMGISASFGGKIVASNLVVRDIDLIGINNTRRLVAENLTLTRCGLDPDASLPWYVRAGIDAVAVSIDGLVATDNGGPAVLDARSTRITNGVMSGNNGFGQGFDLLTHRRPRLTDSTCVKSGRIVIDPGLTVQGTWGVCAGD